MDSLLERIEENTLDALYLFINETLRDRNEFDRFFISLMNVLPHNWSIQRVEVGHEFLGMVSDQLLLFETVTSLEAIKTLIISDGYVPRKDKGSIDTEAFLTALPRARNLINLDIHRLELADMEQVGMLADALESMHESLEEIRLTGLFVASGIPNLDPAIMACIDMSSLRSLAMTCITTTMATTTTTTTTTGTGTNGTANNNANATTSNNNNNNDSNNNNNNKNRTIIGSDCLLDLFQSSSTLQDLSLRAMNFDNDTCGTIAKALKNNLFLTSLDLRQNPNIKEVGCRMILEALERNYDLWCTVMVDCESFQGRFNSLIELNQANRGDLIRNPTSEKLIAFLERLKDDPTALWYFLTIHDTVLYPFVNYLKWKSMKETENETNKQKAREIIIMENETSSKIMMMTNATTMANTAVATATTAMLTNDENDTTTMGGTMLSSASSSSSSLDSDSGIASNKKRSASPIMTAAAAAISVVAAAGNSAATMPALPLQHSQQLQLQQAVSTSKRPRTSAGSTATFATTSPNMGTNGTTTSSSRSRRTATNSTSAAGRRASLADEVSAILASHRQQPDYVEMMEHMDSRALEQEAEAILAQQRRQRLI